MSTLLRSSITLVLALAVTPALGVEWLFDFGGGAAGNVNNVIAGDVDTDPAVSDVEDAIDTTGAATTLDLTMDLSVLDNFGWALVPNTTGTTTLGTPASDIFATDMTNDNLFGFTNWDFAPRPQVDYTISGLDTAATYDFTIFASRMNVFDVREAQYDLTGANSGQALLDASNNTTDVAEINGMQPDANGEMHFTIQPGPNTGSFQEFFYLGALHIESVGGGVVGDYNNNGTVDAADYTVWRDGNSPDDTIAGYNLWVANFGNASSTSSSSSKSVPEPNTLLLCGMLLVGVAVFQRQ